MSTAERRLGGEARKADVAVVADRYRVTLLHHCHHCKTACADL